MAAAAIFALGFAGGAEAAPFCVTVQGISPQCSYYDARECNTQAGLQKGVCTLNPGEPVMFVGTQTYCVVDSSRTALCEYADRGSCNDNASRSGAVCIAYSPKAIQPDPYGLDPKRKY
jgi:hypothetical protein